MSVAANKKEWAYQLGWRTSVASASNTWHDIPASTSELNQYLGQKNLLFSDLITISHTLQILKEFMLGFFFITSKGKTIVFSNPVAAGGYLGTAMVKY